MEIIDNPDIKSFFRKITEMSFTTIIWGIWIYMFLPFLNLILWILGIQIFYVEVFKEAGYLEFIDMISKMGWIIVIVFLILRIWGFYNYRRFGRKDRRKGPLLDTTYESLSEYFQVSKELIPDLQNSKEVVWPIQEDTKK